MRKSREVGFKPGLILTLACLILFVIFVSLALWQFERHREKIDFLSESHNRIDQPVLRYPVFDSDQDLAYRRISLSGRYDRDYLVVEKRSMQNGRAGGRLISPLHISELDNTRKVVLVDRGWISYSTIEEFIANDNRGEETAVAGLLVPLDLDDTKVPIEPEIITAETYRYDLPRINPRRDGPKLQAKIPFPLVPYLLQVEKGESPLIGGYRLPTSRVNHLSYAWTWLVCGAMSIVLWVGLGKERARNLLFSKRQC